MRASSLVLPILKWRSTSITLTSDEKKGEEEEEEDEEKGSLVAVTTEVRMNFVRRYLCWSRKSYKMISLLTRSIANSACSIFLDYLMNILPHQSAATVNPDDVTSAMSAAFAEFLSDETTPIPRLIDPTTVRTETTTDGHDILRDTHPPTSYAVSTRTNSGKQMFLFRSRLFSHIIQ